MKTILKDKKYIFRTYKRKQVVFVRGKGKFVWDSKGKKYLDFFSGVSVCNMGHCHPKVVSAIGKQAKKLIHVSNHYYTRPQAQLAEILVKKTFPGQVFFSNSGAEANECAIKLARKWGRPKGKYEIITFLNSFHGRTFGSLSATGQKKLHKGFEPMLSGFKFAEFNNINSVRKVVNKRTAAVMVEPVLGEGGVYPAKKEFLKQLKGLCRKKKMLLIFDEVQTGLGRTGDMFGYKTYSVLPDILTLAKSLGGGLPIAATIAGSRVSPAFVYGDHGSTFGGNLISAAAALEVMKLITAKVMKNVKVTGKYFIEKLRKLQKKHSCIKEVRGLGLMIGIELDFPCQDIVKFCQEQGLIANCTQNTVLRFLPPLIIGRKDVDMAVKTVDKALSGSEKK
jgi:predicted acetylornithine/succinylornithine family transaminase